MGRDGIQAHLPSLLQALLGVLTKDLPLTPLQVVLSHLPTQREASRAPAQPAAWRPEHPQLKPDQLKTLQTLE